MTSPPCGRSDLPGRRPPTTAFFCAGVPEIDFDLGVIAGNRSYNPLSRWLLPGQDDGVVRVEQAKVAGMADFIVLPQAHSFIMTERDAIEQTIGFLATGRFARTGS